MDSPDYDTELDSGVSLAADSTMYYMKKSADGTLGDMDTEDVIGMANDIAVYPEVFSKLTGGGGEVTTTDPVIFRDGLTMRYFEDRATSFITDSFNMSKDLEEAAIRRDRSALYTAASVTGNQAERIEFDEVNGDLSPLLKLKEHFYFE